MVFMTVFLIGFVLGLVVAAIASFVYWRQQTAVLRHDKALFEGRLRSLLCLVDMDALKPENRDAIRMIMETRRLVSDQDPVLIRKHEVAESSERPDEGIRERESAYEDEVSPLFPR
jgi:hypothetical protein